MVKMLQILSYLSIVYLDTPLQQKSPKFPKIVLKGDFIGTDKKYLEFFFFHQNKMAVNILHILVRVAFCTSK